MHRTARRRLSAWRAGEVSGGRRSDSRSWRVSFMRSMLAVRRTPEVGTLAHRESRQKARNRTPPDASASNILQAIPAGPSYLGKVPGSRPARAQETGGDHGFDSQGVLDRRAAR